MTGFNWRPLYVAIAWTITRDEQFCTDIAGNASAKELTFCASAQLKYEMIEAGCFNIVNEIMTLDPPTRTEEIRTHRLVPGFESRFRHLAEDYEVRGRRDFTDTIAQLPHAPECERNRIALDDFLFGRWHEGFREIIACVSDEKIRCRGVAIDGATRLPAGVWPAASVTDAMWMDLKGTVWEGPQAMWGEQPRQWIDISIFWDDLLRCFPENDHKDQSTQTAAARNACRKWLVSEMKDSPMRRPKCKLMYYKEACSRFQGIGASTNVKPSRTFEAAWSMALDEAGTAEVWGRAGAPKKSPH